MEPVNSMGPAPSPCVEIFKNVERLGDLFLPTRQRLRHHQMPAIITMARMPPTMPPIAPGLRACELEV